MPTAAPSSPNWGCDLDDPVPEGCNPVGQGGQKLGGEHSHPTAPRISPTVIGVKF